MGLHAVEAVFSVEDRMSSIAQTIASNVGTMAGVVGQTVSGIGGDFGELGSALQAVATGPLGMVEYALGSLGGYLQEVQGAMDGFAARTGYSDAAVQMFKTHMEEVFKGGLADNFTEAARAIEAVQTKMQNVDQTDLSAITNEVLGLAKAWGTSPDGVATAVGRLQGMFDDLAKSPQKAIDMITVMAQDTGKPLGEIESIVERYGPKFAAAGISAMGMGGLIVLAANLGLGPQGLGALTTGISRFGERIDGTVTDPKFTNALRQLGLSDLPRLVHDNLISPEQALTVILNKFQDMKNQGIDPTKQAIALFGDATVRAVGTDKLTALKDFSSALGGEQGIAGAAKNVADTMKDDGSLGTAIKQFAANAKTSFEKFADDAWTSFKNVSSSLQRVDWNGVLHDVVDPIVKWWNSLFGENGSISKWVSDTWTKITNIVNGAVAGVRAAFAAVGNAITGALAGVAAFINDLWQKIQAIINYHGGDGPPGQPGDNPMPGGAAGGADDLPEGLTWVGEEGPELAERRGSTISIYPNRQSRQMVGSGTGAHGGGGTTVIVQGGNTIVGQDGMNQFVRTINKGLQGEANRRGERD